MSRPSRVGAPPATGSDAGMARMREQKSLVYTRGASRRMVRHTGRIRRRAWRFSLLSAPKQGLPHAPPTKARLSKQEHSCQGGASRFPKRTGAFVSHRHCDLDDLLKHQGTRGSRRRLASAFASVVVAQIFQARMFLRFHAKNSRGWSLVQRPAETTLGGANGAPNTHAPTLTEHAKLVIRRV